MSRVLSALVATTVLAGVGMSPAFAIKQFQDQFIATYVKDSENEQFVKDVNGAKCFVCHQGTRKTNHNPYGIHLVKLLDKKEDKDNVDKIVAALKEVGKMHSDPKDEKSPTYDELIADGKLPGGTLEEAKKEPKK